MRLRGFNTTRAQTGWVSDCCFMVTTAAQFTSEEHVVRGHGRWMWLAMWRSYRWAKAKAMQMQAKPGERAAKGWAD